MPIALPEGLGKLINTEGLRSLRERLGVNAPSSTPDLASLATSKWAKDNPEKQKLLEGVNPQSYRGIYKTGSQSIGQGGESQPGFEGFLTAGTNDLASAYIDKFYETTGKLPSQEEVSGFVSENLTPTYVANYMTGNTNRDIILNRMVKPALEDAGVRGPSIQPLADNTLSSKLDQIYGDIRNREVQNIRDVFGPARKRAIEESAAAGRLRSGVSYGPDSPIAQTDVNEGKALSNLLSQLSQSRATGEFEAARSDKDLAERMRQFDKSLSLDRQRFRNEQDQQFQQNLYNQQALSLSSKLGQMQADARKPGTLDYLGTAFGGLGALGGLFSGIGAMKKA